MWLVLSPQPLALESNKGTGVKEVPGFKVPASGASRKRGRVEVPLDLSPLQLTNLLYFQPCGHIPDISNLQRSLPDVEIHSFCSCLPILPKLRPKRSLLPVIARKCSNSPSEQSHRFKATPIAKPQPPCLQKAQRQSRRGPRRVSQEGQGRAVFSVRLALLFPAQRARANMVDSWRPNTSREEEEIPPRDIGAEGDSTIPEQHRSFGSQASFCTTGRLPHRIDLPLLVVILTPMTRFEKSHYSTDRTARS